MSEFVYVHHEDSETTVQVPLPNTPPTRAYIVAKFKELAPQFSGNALRVTLDGKTVVQRDDELMRLKPKSDVFILVVPNDDVALPTTCPQTGKTRELYFHVFNSEAEEEPFVSTRKPFRPDLSREQVLAMVFTKEAYDALRRQGDCVTMRYIAERNAEPVEWTTGPLPCYPIGGDIFVYGQPSVPNGRPAIDTSILTDVGASASAAPAVGSQPAPTPASPKDTARQPASATRQPVVASRVEDVKRRIAKFEEQGKFAEAGRILKEAVKEAPKGDERLALQRELVAMWCERAKLPDKAIPMLRVLKAETEDVKHVDHVRFTLALGKALFELKKYSEAGDELHQCLTYMNENKVSAPMEVQKDIKLHLGAAWFAQGKDEGIKVIQDTLGGDVSSAFGVMWMSKAYAVKGHEDDALTWAVTLVVREQQNRAVKANFIELATRIPDSIERIERNVLTQPTKDIASAWAYLGTIARDFGNMSLAIRLYEKATSLPTCPAEAWLTYVHLFEQIGKPLETLQRIADFLKKAPALSADNDAYARDVAPLIAEAAEKAAEGGYALNEEVIRLDEKEAVHVLPPTPEHPAQPWAKTGLEWDPPGATRESGVAAGRRKLMEQELALCGMYFTVVKVLFCMGRLDAIPAIVKKVDLVRRIEKMNRTNMKNEHSYYTTVMSVMQYLNSPLLRDVRPLLANRDPVDGKLYICSDSHSIPMSWHNLIIDGKPTLTVNRLVTGLKIWHIRDDCDFYPKRNFEAVVETIPIGADALFCFGEIDCREGILKAVDKGIYDTHKEAIIKLLGVYTKRLLAVKAARKLRRLFVLAPLPVLDITRHIVVTFNQFFSVAMSQLDGIIPIDVTDDILVAPTPGGPQPNSIPAGAGESRVLREELVLDSTHMTPLFTQKYLEPAIQRALEQRSK
jgi:tetratricopeptide (TPR) repeat protein